jgi:hypothetical protein
MSRETGPDNGCTFGWRIATVGVLSLVAGCGSLGTAEPAATDARQHSLDVNLEDPASAPTEIQAAWVQIGADGEALARAITSHVTQCPRIVIDGVAARMNLRVQAGTAPKRPTSSLATLSKASVFPVTVCEYTIAATTKRALVAGRVLPLPKADPHRIVVLGDTGCRLKQSADAYQSCNEPSQWPLETTAAAAAAMKPDLVLHVGDYHYRENPCPDDISGCTGSPWGFGWDAWSADLFVPAAKLMSAAPWVAVRGNHETCNRAGQGWSRFLDPQPYRTDRSCDDPAHDVEGNYSNAYAVPLGAAEQLIVFDTSSVGAQALPATDPQFIAYRQRFERVSELAAKAGVTSLFASHHPVLGYTAVPGSVPIGAYQYAALQSVMGSMYPGMYYPPGVTLALAGHVHDFQAISYANGSPATIISGNGGDNLDLNLPDPFPANDPPAPGVELQSISHAGAFGFLVMDRIPDSPNWLITAYTIAGKVLTTCAQSGKTLTCDKTGFISPP